MEKKATPEPAQPARAPKIEVKTVLHHFTDEEIKNLGRELADAWSNHGQIEREAKAVKKGYDARLEEMDGKIANLSTQIREGLESREERCQVRYYPKERKKRYWLEHADPEKEPFAIEEQMLEVDFQQELLLADSRFDLQERIQLFPSTEKDSGLVVVGVQNKVWYAAVRAKIGAIELNERLDSEQPISAKVRFDALQKAVKRFQKWVLEAFGQDAARGFEEPVKKALEAQKERAE